MLADHLFFRPVKWLSSPEYASGWNARWHRIFPQLPSIRSTPARCGKIVIDLQEKLEPEFPEIGVLELNRPLLYGSNGWIFSQEGYLLPDHSWYGRHTHEMKIPRFRPIKKRLKGVCLFLASDFSVGNYGHFLLDCLPRLELFYQAGFKLSDVDYIFCPKPTSKPAQDFFKQLSIPISKCIWANENRNTAIQVETLIAPSFPGARRNYPSWLPSFLQRTFLSSSFHPKRRLYISRTNCRRNVVNEATILPILSSYGFELYNPVEHNNPPRDFAESAIIVGPHGGGLADLAFCQPGTKVLELIPTDHAHPYYYTLAEAAQLKYAYLAGHSTTERKPGTFGPSIYDFYIDENELEVALAQITVAETLD